MVDPTNNNRSYKGKTITAANSADLKAILDAKAAMKGKPVIVSLALSKPTIVAEFEKEAAGIIASFGVQDQALLDILSGAAEPTALLPLQLAANMKTVEEQNEDVPHDMTCYTDAAGHSYDFGYGLNWKGIISDARTQRYKHVLKKGKGF